MSRKRYVYTSGGQPLPEPIEVDLDWRNTGFQAPRRSEEEVYGHITATDGTDLSTRRRHREYMKAHNVTMMSDFKSTWDRDAKERAAMQRGDFDHKQRKEQLGRAAYELKEKRRRR